MAQDTAVRPRSRADFDTWQNRVMQRTWKITHGGSGQQMGPRRLLVYCSDTPQDRRVHTGSR